MRYNAFIILIQDSVFIKIWHSSIRTKCQTLHSYSLLCFQIFTKQIFTYAIITSFYWEVSSALKEKYLAKCQFWFDDASTLNTIRS
ncbi:unnamed protein product [Rotaria socialis]